MHRDHHANEQRDFLRDPGLGGAAHVAPVHQVERQFARGSCELRIDGHGQFGLLPLVLDPAVRHLHAAEAKHQNEETQKKP
jgi:hypothetical protein